MCKHCAAQCTAVLVLGESRAPPVQHPTASHTPVLPFSGANLLFSNKIISKKNANKSEQRRSGIFGQFGLSRGQELQEGPYVIAPVELYLDTKCIRLHLRAGIIKLEGLKETYQFSFQVHDANSLQLNIQVHSLICYISNGVT